MITHNLRLVVYIAKKFESTKINIEDLISIGSMGLIKAVQTFKMEKNIKLATYASRCIENEILMYLRKTSKQKLEISIDEPLNIDYDGNELLLGDILAIPEETVIDEIADDEQRKIMYKAIEELKPREKEIIKMRYGLMGEKEKTQKEIADTMNISRSYVSRIEKRALIKMLREFIKNNNV